MAKKTKASSSKKPKSFTNTKSAMSAASAIAGKQSPLNFKPGGLHTSTGTPQGQKIPIAKMSAALSGGFGAKAKKQANFKKNVLTGKK